MRERIANLGWDVMVLATIGLAAFGGQVIANHVPMFGQSPVVTRLIIIEDRLDALDEKVNRKIGF